MADTNDEGAVDPAETEAMGDLIDSVGKVLIDTVNGPYLSARGVLYGAALAMRCFALTAKQVEGWTEEELKANYDEAIASSIAAQYGPPADGPTRH